MAQQVRFRRPKVSRRWVFVAASPGIQAAPQGGGKIPISKEDTALLKEKRAAFEKALMEWEVNKVGVAWRYTSGKEIWANSQFDESMTHIVPRYKSTEPEDVSLRIGK